jgi:hypothetical protein
MEIMPVYADVGTTIQSLTYNVVPITRGDGKWQDKWNSSPSPQTRDHEVGWGIDPESGVVSQRICAGVGGTPGPPRSLLPAFYHIFINS